MPHSAPMATTARREPKAEAESLLRNRTILERLGCLDEDGVAKLRTGKAPTITKGPYKGELATGDHIIPRSVCPELDNKLFNLEFMPATINGREEGGEGRGEAEAVGEEVAPAGLAVRGGAGGG